MYYVFYWLPQNNNNNKYKYKKLIKIKIKKRVLWPETGDPFWGLYWMFSDDSCDFNILTSNRPIIFWTQLLYRQNNVSEVERVDNYPVL